MTKRRDATPQARLSEASRRLFARLFLPAGALRRGALPARRGCANLAIRIDRR